jgi:hypothetical protein
MGHAVHKTLGMESKDQTNSPKPEESGGTKGQTAKERDSKERYLSRLPGAVGAIP